MKVLIDNIQDRFPIPAGFFPLLQELVRALLQAEGRGENEEIGLILVDDAYIRELNLAYRDRDRATDVLAFDLQDEASGQGEDTILGDVYISVERAAEQARDYGHSLQREVAFLAVHGILHLLGYDHQSSCQEADMDARQTFIMEHFHENLNERF